MHRLIAFAACLVSCASGSQYQRGAPAAPTPAFSPTRAAPHTVGQPGWEPPEYPRGGSRRVLPETPATRREPGLWGSEPPKAQAGAFPRLLEVPVPVPPDMSRDLGYLSVVNGCAYLLDMAVDGVGLREQAQDLDTNARRCLVALSPDTEKFYKIANLKMRDFYRRVRGD